MFPWSYIYNTYHTDFPFEYKNNAVSLACRNDDFLPGR